MELCVPSGADTRFRGSVAVCTIDIESTGKSAVMIAVGHESPLQTASPDLCADVRPIAAGGWDARRSVARDSLVDRPHDSSGCDADRVGGGVGAVFHCPGIRAGDPGVAADAPRIRGGGGARLEAAGPAADG